MRSISFVVLVFEKVFIHFCFKKNFFAYYIQTEKQEDVVLKKFGTNKKNPNPPWPNQQSVVVVPPGINANPMKLPQKNQNSLHNDEAVFAYTNDENTSISERDLRRDPIMGKMIMNNQTQNQLSDSKSCHSENFGVTQYLCGKIGNYVRIEFLFGDNVHIEKIGILRDVGKDFVAITENGTNNTIVCSTNRIKFVNVYEYL